SLQGKISSDGCLKKEQMVVSAIASTPHPVSSMGEGITPPYLPPRHFADCHNQKRTVEEI
ncbi:hypothetical protein, partial [Escherichia coli]|uniref:hypothetical protein n=1 Tax=Escherichia coli TaxID=562 RepID=UPI001BC8BD78